MRAQRSRTRTVPTLLIAPLVILAPGFLACSRNEPESTTTFYDRRIAPIVQGSCVTSSAASSCHVAADNRGNALGNLNLESYDTLALRRDLLIDYGPYGVPALLLRVVPPYQIRITSWDETQAPIITTDIAHAGGSLLDFTSSAFTTLQNWIENGAAENNAPSPPREVPREPCSSVLGDDPAFDPAAAPNTPDYARFADEVNPVLGQNCAAGNCHGNPSNSLYLTCGEGAEQERWNYFAASDYVADPPERSEILRRTLDPAQGGTYHEGGAIFREPGDPDYEALVAWARERGSPINIPADEGFAFFHQRVQPMLVKRGCMQLACHSAAMFHDYRLRGGSGGHFGLPATRTNYRLTLEQVALESPDPNASRLLRKNFPAAPRGSGARHRGGALFAGGDPAECDRAAAATGPLDEQDPYCVIVAWIELERSLRMADALPLSGIVYVRRPATNGPDTPQDWAAYTPGAEVVMTGATLTDGAITLGTETSLSALCGLATDISDARRPAVSWDGARIAFAARTGESEPYRIHVVDGSSCAVEPTIDAPPVDDAGNRVPNNGELVHNFDPQFAPDGRIVFASTRGNTKNVGAFSYQGPQRTPADPSKLNANLYVLENGAVRQLTFLLNQELTPSFMSDGRLIFVAEKRAPDFYQLAGRRMNLDGGDYHPLFGQRSTIGHNQFTDVVELTDKNLAAIASDRGAAHGAGRLVFVNRSIGVDQLSDRPEDYLQDEGAISWPNPDFYQHSLRSFDSDATGRLDGTNGAYRNPSPLPDGRLLVSYALGVTNLGNFAGNFDIYVGDPSTNILTPLIQNAQDLLWPVAVYARQNHGVFESRLDEANGATTVDPNGSIAELLFADVPLLVSLMFQNTRTGRILNEERPSLTIWESLPPEPGVESYAAGGSFVANDDFGQYYVRRRALGSPQIFDDGSAKVLLPGGLPILFETEVQLSGDSEPTQRFQREEIQVYPGESLRQSFRRDLFDGLCAGCHGSLSGLESNISVNPDILTQASAVAARDRNPTDLTNQGGNPEGPPFP